MAEFHIGDQSVGSDEPTFIIAEAGSNHNGNRDMAFDLIDAAADAGADAVKFQTFRAAKMYPKDSGDIGTADSDAYSTLKPLEMPYDWIPDLADYASEQDVHFLSSPFDKRAADILEEHVPAYKVGSTLVSHHPFLKYLIRKNKPLIISTGAHTMDDISSMLTALNSEDTHKLALLQCVSAYPTPLKRVNVSVLETLRETFDIPTGLSDHTKDPTTAPIVAASLGAAIIEKHITLDKNLPGPDHSFALEPDQFDNLVSQVRMAEGALGDGEKAVLNIEAETHENGRRCLHAARPLSEGEILTEEDIAWLRPGENPRGVPPSKQEAILGSQVIRDIDRGVSISYDDIDD